MIARLQINFCQFHHWDFGPVLVRVISAAAVAKSFQTCPTLCDPKDGSPPGSAAPGILQARTLEWVAISFSNAWKWKVKVKSLSRVWLLSTPWTVAYQAPPSMGFSRQEYWSGVPLPSLRVISTQVKSISGWRERLLVLIPKCLHTKQGISRVWGSGRKWSNLNFLKHWKLWIRLKQKGL